MFLLSGLLLFPAVVKVSDLFAFETSQLNCSLLLKVNIVTSIGPLDEHIA